MLTTRSIIAISAVATITTVLSPGTVSGQDYPGRPVRIITAQAGGGTDFMARLIAQGLRNGLGQPVIVDNRPTLIAIEAAAKAAPDGYSLSIASTLMWITPLIRDTPWDPIRDFAAVSLLAITPHLLIVHPSLPVNSVKELIALARARPGELNYQYSGAGGATHLAGELLKSMAGVKITSVPYQGSGPGMSALMNGEVQMGFETPISSMPLVKSGRVKVLAIATLQPSALAPGVPTVAASGLPGFQSGASYALLVPAKTPEAVVRRLNQEAVRFVNMSDTKQKILATGTDPVGSSPEELTALIKSEMVKFGKLIKDVGIEAK